MDFYITCNYLHLGCWLHSQELFSQCLKPTFGFVFWPWDICLLAISHCCFYSVLARLVRRVGRGVSFLRFWWSISPRQTLCPGLKNNSHSEVCPAVGGGRPLTSFPAPLPHGTKSTHIPLFWPVSPVPLLQLLWVSTSVLRLLPSGKEEWWHMQFSFSGCCSPSPATHMHHKASLFFLIFPVIFWWDLWKKMSTIGHHQPYMWSPGTLSLHSLSHLIFSNPLKVFRLILPGLFGPM